MKKILTTFILAGVMALVPAGSILFAADQPAAGVQKLDLRMDARYNVKEGAAEYPIGFGSGLDFAGDQQGSLRFYGITDRGPNLDGPKVGKLSSKLFPAPSFHPSLVEIQVRDGAATIVKVITLKSGTSPISGLPVPPGSVGFTKEAALSLEMKDLGNDAGGMDTEAIRIDPTNPKQGWISDEYGPFVAQINLESGEILKKLAPGAGLPEIIARRQPNRGMEGLAITPSGKLLGAMQSIIDVDGEVKKSKATFIRLVHVDPVSGKTMTYAYPHDRDAYKKSADAKIGDIVALPGSETEFLILEQGKGKDKQMRNLIYKISLQGATDITDKKAADSKELETLAEVADLEALGIKIAGKELVYDLREKGWNVEKAEGIAVLDAHRFAVISDNDFGVSALIENPASDKDGKPVDDAGDYEFKDGKLYYEGNETGAKIVLKRTSEPAAFWLCIVEKPLF